MGVIERCPGITAVGRCHRRLAHHGHCATGGSYAKALDERDYAREHLRTAEDRIAALETALGFYSDGFAYLAPEGWRRIWRDGGQTAREAIGGR